MTLANRIINVGASSTLAITAKAKKMQKEGVDVVSFGAGEPDFDTPKNIKEAGKKAIDEAFTKYTPSSGIAELKEAVCQKFKKDNKLDYSPSQIVVSCGAKHSLYNVIQVMCQKGDEVLIPSPYWISYPEMVKLAEAMPVTVPTSRKNGFKLTKADLEKAITRKTKLLILNSPSNPTGTVYDEKELFSIAELASERGIYVLSDEIYEKILYDGARHVSVASFNKKIYDLTITVNGVSKTYSMTGWRIGYLAGPQEVVTAIDNLQSHSTSNPASMCQKAAVEAIAGNQDFISSMVGEFKGRRDYMVERLSRIKGFSPFVPRGAFYLFCEITGTGLGSVDLAGKLLDEAKVAVVPGDGFGWGNYIRLSFATSMEKIKKGIDRIEKWAKR